MSFFVVVVTLEWVMGIGFFALLPKIAFSLGIVKNNNMGIQRTSCGVHKSAFCMCNGQKYTEIFILG